MAKCLNKNNGFTGIQTSKSLSVPSKVPVSGIRVLPPGGASRDTLHPPGGMSGGSPPPFILDHQLPPEGLVVPQIPPNRINNPNKNGQINYGYSNDDMINGNYSVNTVSNGRTQNFFPSEQTYTGGVYGEIEPEPDYDIIEEDGTKSAIEQDQVDVSFKHNYLRTMVSVKLPFMIEFLSERLENKFNP